MSDNLRRYRAIRDALTDIEQVQKEKKPFTLR
jgi:hypothetical protein